MYTPSRFRMDDTPVLHGLMERHSFATLLTPRDTGMLVTHLPFLVDRTRGELGTLVGHVARANPHWRAFGAGSESVVVFLGPHGYISPAWYRDPAEVPTWNYTAVHAFGSPRVLEKTARLLEIVEALTDVHEARLGRPWEREKARDVVAKQLSGIVGFEMQIARLEGKFKLGQNRSIEDRESVVRVLESGDDPFRRELAVAMRESLASEARADAPGDPGE